MSEVWYLSELPQLTELVLKENPICQLQAYPIQALCALRASRSEVRCDYVAAQCVGWHGSTGYCILILGSH